MKMLPKKTGLLFAAALALAGFVLPSTASAVGWEVDSLASLTHSLTSTDFAINMPAAELGLSCTNSKLHTDFVSTTNLKVTAAAFSGCTGTNVNGVGCTTTAVGTGFAWTATGTSTNGGVRIHGINVDFFYEGTCGFNGQNLRVTGTLSGGDWNNTLHQAVFSSDTGLLGHSVLGTIPITVSGALRDDQQTLTVR